MNSLISYEILIPIVLTLELTQTGLVPRKHTNVGSFLSCEMSILFVCSALIVEFATFVFSFFTLYWNNDS